MPIDPAVLEDIEHAFIQLEFAIKLMCYCELEHLDKDKFDTDITILLEKENVGFRSGSFSQYSQIITASQINVGICFGVTAIVLDAAFDAVKIQRNPKLRDPASELRTLIYMVRCAFAHNIAQPKWDVRGDFAHPIQFNLGNQIYTIDTVSLHDQDFQYSDIGGFAMWYKIKETALDILKAT